MKHLWIGALFALCICSSHGNAKVENERIVATAKANLLTLSPEHKEPIKVFFSYREKVRGKDWRQFRGKYSNISYTLTTPNGVKRSIKPLDTRNVTDQAYTDLEAYQYFELPHPLQLGMYTIIESGKMAHVADEQLTIEYTSSPAIVKVTKRTRPLSNFRALADQVVAKHFNTQLKDIDWIIRDESEEVRLVSAGLSPSVISEELVPIGKRKKLEYGGYRVRLKFSPTGALIESSITPVYWHID